MALSSNQLEAFLTVSQTLSFTRAATLLHLTQSALSQRVLNLERELATTLFIRDRSGLRLTETAHELVRYCRSKSALEDEFLAKLKSSGLEGEVRIGGFSSVMSSVVIPALEPLLTAHPGLRVHLVTAELTQLPERLHTGEIDFMILDRRETREELERISLGKERNVLVQKRKYNGPEIFLDHDENDTTTKDYLKLAGRKSKKIERRYLDDIHGLIAGVRRGFGRAVIPKHLLTGEFEILDPEMVLEIPVFLYFYSQPYYSKLHTKIVNALVEGARQQLG